jgi:hypothetical protein
MGGIPQQPLEPAANLNPFGVQPVAGDTGGRPAEATPAVGANAIPATPEAPPTAPPPPGEDPTKKHEQQGTPQGVTINIGGEQKPGAPGAPTLGQAPGVPGGAAAPPTNPAAPGLPAPVKMDRLPTSPEMEFAPPGSTFETPIGTITKDATGKRSIQLNEAGIVKYKEAKARATTAFGGYPLAGSPGAPLPPVEPGQPAFNPFTNTWIGE